MTPRLEDDLLTLAEVVVAVLATVGLIVAAWMLGAWTA